MQKVKSMSLGKKLIPIVIGALIIIIALMACKQPYDEYTSVSKTNKDLIAEKKNKEDQVAQLEQEQAAQRANMDSLKQFMPLNGEFSADSLASFGSMLEEIIDNYIKPEGIMLRSIDYQIDPEEDPISSKFAPTYHSCTVELRLIAKYPQLHDFLYHIINDYPYFLSISQIVITAYPADKEYLDINLGINLYVKKPD